MKRKRGKNRGHFGDTNYNITKEKEFWDKARYEEEFGSRIPNEYYSEKELNKERIDMTGKVRAYMVVSKEREQRLY